MHTSIWDNLVGPNANREILTGIIQAHHNEQLGYTMTDSDLLIII